MSREWARSCFEHVVAVDFYHLFVGDKLGEGVYRTVFRMATDETKVIKFEHRSATFCNVNEWNLWNHVKEDRPQLAKWFAPCHHISPCGNVLIQDYAAPVEFEKLPAKVPAVFTDLKMDNWGKIGRRIVCRDYGNNRVFQEGANARLRKAYWWKD